MILGIQIIGILFGLFMLYYTFIHFKRNEISRPEVILWTFAWLFFIFLTIFPNSLDFVASSLNLSRTMDFLIIMGFLFLIGLTYYDYFVTKKNQKKVELLVRKIAIEKKR